MDKIKVATSKVKVSSAGTVTVESSKLANALIQDNKSVLTELGVKASEITLLKDGKLKISNKSLAERIKADLGSAALNIGCGLGC